MKQSPDLQKAQENMRCGNITLHGFLGSDTRNLIDILLEDDALVKRLGLNHKQIAQRMQYLRDVAFPGMGDYVTVDEIFLVKVDSVRGKLPCPFIHSGVYRKTVITVRNIRLKKEIMYTDLNIHMIEAHGFYEGKGSAFRQEPAVLKNILDIQEMD